MPISKKFKNNNFKDAYQEVTDAVIKTLEEGTVMWKCTWNKFGLPKNVTTGVNYRGWNLVWLNFYTMHKGYTTPYYITYKQAQQLGGTIKKGQKGVKITFWASVELKKATTGEELQFGDEEESTKRTKLIPKEHTVFNIDQTAGIEFPKVEAMFRTDAAKNEACELIIAGMPQMPVIEYQGDQAYYNPMSDTVTVPPIELHQSNESFYSVLFHELAHSTGHKSRLNRKELVESDGFGGENYSKEELTAELTAAFLCAITGIEQGSFDNSASYINGWLKALKNDKTLVFKAATQAQKAADFILNKLEVLIKAA